MFNQIVLILIAAMILLSLAITLVPIPVLWGAACLIFIALSVAERRAYNG